MVFLLALLPRLYGLGQRPFWYDEVVTVYRSSLPWAQLISDSLHQHHSPLYFLLVGVFDHSHDPQFWVRLPSAIFGALAVMLVYLNASRVAGVGAGIAAALVIGLAPTEIAYSQEARSYAMEMFFILLALHGLLGLVLARERAALPWRAPGAALADWIQFIVGSAAALCTLGDSLPWLVAANATAAMLIWRAHDRAGMRRNFITANVLLLGACLPIYGAMLWVKSNPLSKSFGFIPHPSLSLIWFEIESVYLMRVADVSSFHLMNVPTPPAVTWLIGTGLVAALLASLWHLRREAVLQASLLFALLALPLGFGLISIWQPMLMVRYLLWSGAVFAILVGIGAQAGLQWFSRRARLLMLLVGSAVLLFNLVPFYSVETKPRWDVAAKLLAAESQQDDVFYLSSPIAALPLRFYVPASLQGVRMTDDMGDLQHAIQAHRQGKQVWVIYGDDAQRINWTSLTAFRASLAPLGTPSTVQHAGERITIWRYAAPAAEGGKAP